MKRKDIGKPEHNPNALTEEELSMLKKSISSEKTDRSKLPHYDNSDRAKLFRFIAKNKIITVIAALALACAIIVVAVGVAFAVRRAGERVNTDDLTIILGDEKYTVKYKDAVRNDILYIDMYKIADYASLIKTGSSTSVKFTGHSDTYLRFENASETAVVNGALVELGGVAKVTDKVCEIPLEFLQKAIGGTKDNGLKISFDTKTNTIKLTRRMYQTDKRDVYTPVEVLFYSDSFSVLQSIKAPPAPEEYEYSIDISAYMDSIEPKDASAYLILANKESPLGKDHKPADLTELACKTADNRKMYLREDAANALYAMMLEMSAAGITDVYVTSAYRAYSRQAELFERYVAGHMAEGMTREEAEAAALEYSARAGTSEHQTGLCIDFMTKDMTDLDESFEKTEAFRWLSENAHKYGFILRYPSDKVDTTGYKYEPWHYRFVGRSTASQIYEADICFEEYLKLN